MELFLMPFILPCGHIFCYSCLDDLSQHPNINSFCPVCRMPIGDQFPTRCRIAENLSKQFFNFMSEEEQAEYSRRNSNMLKKFQERAAENSGASINDKIDIKVGNHWEPGIIMKIYQR